MRKLIWGFILFILAICLGLFIRADPGYILISYRHVSIETTLWFAILAIILAYFVLRLVINLILWATGVSGRLQIVSRRRHRHKSQRLTNQGLGHLAEAHWKQAEKALTRALPNETPLINYLAAAYAAHSQGDFSKRDDYLRQAHQSSPGAELAIGLIQARLQLDAHQYERALATLCHLKQLAPKHAFVLKLLARTYLTLEDWPKLEKLLPTLEKVDALKPSEMASMQRQVYVHLLQQDNADEVFKRLPKILSKDPQVYQAYIHTLIKNNQHDRAESLCRETLKKVWDEGLITTYGDIRSSDLSKQLAFAEGWLKQHPNDAALLHCLGRLALANELWGKAKSYLQQSTKYNPSPAALYDLSRAMQAGQTVV